MDQTKVDDLKERLRILATLGSELVTDVLARNSLKTMQLLAMMGPPKVCADDIREDEIQVREFFVKSGIPFKDNHPDHKLVYDKTQEALNRVDDAFEAVLEAAALLYVLCDHCECAHCKRRRQREQARNS